ncbi:hypothetical protein TNCT_543091 [Trichonephila clavata]|uniref:Uncharacterized protein n=1 Tax=Trichonephila clavata TaxID=2740835 RepID=A0A8X6GY75_TRICU|nr:hypothetical protein TNCT_543091 [Trichonephila clavata]
MAMKNRVSGVFIWVPLFSPPPSAMVWVLRYHSKSSFFMRHPNIFHKGQLTLIINLGKLEYQIRFQEN